MSYLRVIPRDLFNEANLLKCLGKLYLNLENLAGHSAELLHESDSQCFDVRQDQDGGLFVMNVTLWVGGRQVGLRRPLNSRAEWPLYALPLWDDEDGEEISVFNENGMFSAEMLAFLLNPPKA